MFVTLAVNCENNLAPESPKAKERESAQSDRNRTVYGLLCNLKLDAGTPKVKRGNIPSVHSIISGRLTRQEGKEKGSAGYNS
jgi:hypothetical protein